MSKNREYAQCPKTKIFINIKSDAKTCIDIWIELISVRCCNLQSMAIIYNIAIAKQIGDVNKSAITALYSIATFI